MSTTPQRYSEPDETRSYMRGNGLGPWVRFTDHEAAKVRAVAEVRKEIDQGETLVRELENRLSNAESHISDMEQRCATQQATIAQLTKALNEMERLATKEGWNTPLFESAYGDAVKEARAAVAAVK
jgi:uncharacterized coiled-coil protein SlyX